ncbi:MAG: long-chain fatty acid--CoA ligase [candidate division WOR-3 bacterium]
MERIWIKFYDKGVKSDIEIPKVPLFHFLLETVKNFPEKDAYIFFDKRTKFKELLVECKKFASFLKENGIKKKDRVALLLPNTPHFIISYYGTMMAGGIVVQLNPLLSDREVSLLLKNSGSKVLVILDILLPRFLNSVKSSNIDFLIVAQIDEYFPLVKRIGFKFLKILKGINEKLKGLNRKYFFFREIENYKEIEDFEKIDPEEDIASLQYTGGTTGIPKGAMLTHYNLVANTLQTMEWVPDLRKGEEVVMGVLPFFHVYGMSVALNFSIASGSTLIIVPKFHTKEILENIEKYKVTIFPGVPQMYQAINNFKDIKKYKLSTIRACISGAAPLPPQVKDKFEELTGAKLVEGYGLSEASPVTHCNPIYGKNKRGSIGIPFPNTLAKIVDLEKGEKEMPIGEPGELIVKGPQVMKGYWKSEEETKKVIRDGWLFTGDIAKMDEEGYFYILDRKKDLIIVSGFNVYPRNVEEALLSHPKIKDVACVGIPYERTGEAVKVFIVPKEGETLTKEEVIEFSRKNLAKYEVPVEVEFVREIPRTAVGKTLRRVLKEKS